ncbi:MAG TPA: DUF72 domain-containing protein [Gemmatimonadaceae bacterium]|nr:DUF72 domain-containing protein [Gemmatimonadaceae bacterium]
MAGIVHIGTQGWNYDAWVGPFYPPRTRAADFLGVYARAFDTVEVDSTFYAVPSAKTVRAWADRTPPHFRFALKMPQEVTHERRLRDAGLVAAEFFDRARELGDRLGPVLLQFPPDFTPTELPALADFLPTLPSDVRCAVEFRHKGWIYDGVLALLAEHGVALALIEGKWIPRKQVFALAERLTADFVYVRWLGNREIVDFSRVQMDRTRDLEAWAGVLARLEKDGRTVYGYFNNHFSGHSPASARELQRLLHQHPVDPALIGEQMSLF